MSPDAPHMSKDKRYYKRNNFEAKEMEEYEVRNIYNRVTKTKIEITSPMLSFTGLRGNFPNIYTYECILDIFFRNTGTIIDDKIKIEIEIPTIALVENRMAIIMKENLLRRGKTFCVLSFLFDKVLFPNEENKIGNIYIGFDSRSVNLLKENQIKVKLYYSGGFEEKSFNLYEHLILSDSRFSTANFISS